MTRQTAMGAGVLAAVAICIGAIYTITAAGERASGVTGARSHGPSSDVEIAQLRARIQDLEARLAVPAAAAPRTASSDPPEPAAAGLEQTHDDRMAKSPTTVAFAPAPEVGRAASALVQQAEAAAQRQREAATLEQALAADDYDGAWANAFSEELEQGLQAEPFAGTQLVDVQCKSTLCRIDVTHESDQNLETFLGHLTDLEGFNSVEYYWQREVHADGSSAMKLYVARSGHSLPAYTDAQIADRGR